MGNLKHPATSESYREQMAQNAYEVYRADTRTYGNLLIEEAWEDLGDIEQHAWIAAVNSVIEDFKG